MMKRILFVTIILVFILTSCATKVDSTVQPTSSSAPASTATITASTATAAPTPTPGITFYVTNTENSGDGSLRDMILKAAPGDQILFDPQVFPPDRPATIFLQSSLMIQKGHITIDASNAGVILDGSKITNDGWVKGIALNSSGNIIRGLQIQHFSGTGILIDPASHNNVIGGDRSIGDGPFGQGNQIIFNGEGIFVGGSQNTILGNLIGTDALGQAQLGNQYSGVYLKNAASDNIIGPGNIIAYNAPESVNGGVNFGSGNTKNNRITQNQIFGNSAPDIYYNLVEGAHIIPLAPPVLVSVDFNSGKVTGAACPGCSIEFFSTTPEGMQIFEGDVVVDESGVFIFEKEGGFRGTELRANAFVAGQNTSEFSLPVTEQNNQYGFQNNNANPILELANPAYEELGQNRLGSMYVITCDNLDNAGLYAHTATEIGEKFLRINLEWFDWPEAERRGEYSDFEISDCQEEAMNQLTSSGVELVYVLTYWDPEIQITDGYSRFRDDAEIERFLEYTRFIVNKYKGKIRYYSLLNEPNLTDGQRGVEVEDYIRLAERVIPVIREIEPDARIILGEVTPLIEPNALNYLLSIENSELMPLVDGIAWHGFSGNTPAYETDFYNAYPGMVNQIVETARANGFTGDFFATELQYRTSDTNMQLNDEHKKYVYSHMVSVKYYLRGIVYHRGQDFWVTAGHEDYERIPGMQEMLIHLSSLLSDVQAINLPVTFDSPNPNQYKNVAFTAPDGSLLLALWNDVSAVDHDPGVATEIKIPGVQADGLTAMDPIFSGQQSLDFLNDENGITIPNFLIKDYPIFIRLENPNR